MARRKLVAGNWKMHGSLVQLAELDAIAEAARANPQVDVAICPPSTLIAAAAARAVVTIGAQDVHPKDKGAHTGDVSAAMLKEAGAKLVIVGHSERRADHGETSALVQAKAEAVIAAGLIAIVCIGETETERLAGRAVEVVEKQLTGSTPAGVGAANLVVAYEPVWAIGTGRTPTVDDVADIHASIRAKLRSILGDTADQVRILYGGSVKASNAAELMAVADVDGALVGGASLTAADFVPIIEAAAA
jgi:triosephosphate isomerase